MKNLWFELKERYKNHIMMGELIIFLAPLVIALVSTFAAFWLWVIHFLWPVTLHAASYCAITAGISIGITLFIHMVSFGEGIDLDWP